MYRLLDVSADAAGRFGGSETELGPSGVEAELMTISLPKAKALAWVDDQIRVAPRSSNRFRVVPWSSP
jgi:hypothetical protein